MSLRYLLNKPGKEIPSVLLKFLRRKFKGIQSLVSSGTLSDKAFERSLFSPYVPCSWEHKRYSKGCSFFIQCKKKDELLKGVQTYFSGTMEETIQAADNYCAHHFSPLGSDLHEFGERIDWHLDFKSGYRWNPGTPSAFLRYDEYEKGYDVKVPWELSRFQHLPALGKAYWYTGDEKYAREFTNQVWDWIRENPRGRGVNWICTMDVAIRAVNWIWGYFFFEDSPTLTPEFRENFFKSILIHGRHIFSNLETGFPTSNHYLSDLVGLICIGLTFPEFRESQSWFRFGISEFEKEIGKQVNQDGSDFEASIPYHRLVLEMALSVSLLCKMNKVPLSPDTVNRVEKMCEFVMHYTKPTGEAPQIGDNDSGRLHILSEATKCHVNDHRYLLAIGAALYERPDFARAAGKFWEEAYWLLGPEGMERFLELAREPQSNLVSTAFRDAGIYVMRKDDYYLVVDAGGNGQAGNGGHAHNDIFSFELAAFGEDFIVDRGTYVYTGNYKMRNEFRSTRSHNTVEIDGKEINPFDEKILFQLKDLASPTVLEWRTSPEQDIFIGEHQGYARLPDPVVHRRAIHFDKHTPHWRIHDQLFCKGPHEVSVRFHTPLHYEELFRDNDLPKLVPGSKGFLAIYPLQSTAHLPIIQPCALSPSYGRLREGFSICYTYSIKGTASLQFLLLPCRTREEIPEKLKRSTSGLNGNLEPGETGKLCAV